MSEKKEKVERKRITEVIDTYEIVENLKDLAVALKAEDGKRGVAVGMDGWEDLIDVIAAAQIIGEDVKYFGKMAVLDLSDYVPFVEGCKAKHLYGKQYDIKIEKDNEISPKCDKEGIVKQLLTLYGVSPKGIEELSAILSIGVKKVAEVETKVNAAIMGVLTTKGYAITEKKEVTVNKPALRSKRSSGAKAVSTSHNREVDQVEPAAEPTVEPTKIEASQES